MFDQAKVLDEFSSLSPGWTTLFLLIPSLPHVWSCLGEGGDSDLSEQLQWLPNSTLGPLGGPQTENAQFLFIQRWRRGCSPKK